MSVENIKYDIIESFSSITSPQHSKKTYKYIQERFKLN